jgi:hypothetical protein
MSHANVEPGGEVGDGVIDNLINDLKENAFRRADVLSPLHNVYLLTVAETTRERPGPELVPERKTVAEVKHHCESIICLNVWVVL